VIKLRLPGASEELNGFLDQGAEFMGELRFRDTFRVDGRLRGRVVSENTLVVGEAGRVEADIDCAVVSIHGYVKGRVIGRERIELLAGAQVEGTLISPKIVIEDGASFKGDLDMTPPAAAQQKPAAEAPAHKDGAVAGPAAAAVPPSVR
jgi:cytoskeletal protein CcmA (bactofilin family)